MFGSIKEINNNMARVMLDNGVTSAWLKFAYTPLKGQLQVFDYKVGDRVIVEISNTDGVILGVFK